ncbi:hypothetical protein [Sphingobacterium alimentarium]|nr:hypothetical protein [Sphingobacterium alimentarium]
MIVLSVIISLGLGTLYDKNRQLSDKKSYEMRYRMMELDFPNVTSNIDSVYSHDPSKFHKLVIKREEEKKLIFNIKKTQKDIRDLDNDKL